MAYKYVRKTNVICDKYSFITVSKIIRVTCLFCTKIGKFFRISLLEKKCPTAYKL